MLKPKKSSKHYLLYLVHNLKFGCSVMHRLEYSNKDLTHKNNNYSIISDKYTNWFSTHDLNEN